MNVLFITDPGVVGGATRSLVDVVTSLAKQGIKPIVCTSDDNELNAELSDLGIENFASHHRSVMDVPPKSWWKRSIKFAIKKIDYFLSIPCVMRRIEKYIDFSEIDIIHTNSARNDIGCILAKKYKIPHIVHIREFGQEDFGCVCYRNNFYGFINKYTNKFIAISNAVRDSWIKKGLAENKIKVIYNGIDNDDISTTSIETMLSNVDLHGIIAGGICEAKGQLECVEAINLLSDDIKEHIYVDFVGWNDPEYLLNIQERISEYGLDNNIKILPAKKTVHPILGKYQFALMCSKSEGFGRVTAEYMFAGLGVIASNTGANPELISDSENGLIYSLGNYQELADKIETFYKDRKLLVRCGNKAKIDADSKYKITHNVREILELYKELSTLEMS